MNGRCLLFTYGLLRPEAPTAPRSASQAWPDRLRGVMFDLGDYPGAVGLGTAEGWIRGHTVEIAESELEALDAFEDVPIGLFARRLVTTEGGRVAWAYEYLGVVPADAAPLEDWASR